MTPANPEEARLTPFIGPMQDRLLEAIRGWLALPTGLSLTLREGSPAGRPIGLRLWIEAPRLQLPVELDASTERRPGALIGPGTRLTLGRPGAGRGDPALAALVALLERRVAAGAPPAVWEARAAWLPFAGHEDRSFRRFGPSTAGRVGQLRTGFGCNQGCGFCWQDRRWPEAPPGWIDRWLEEMLSPPDPAAVITFTGGEPTLSRDLPRWIARARAGGAEVGLQTNAIRLRDPAYTRRLVEAGLGHALISLHSHDPLISDRLTRAPGTWRHTVAGIGAALDAGLVVALNCVVGAENLAGLPAYARFVLERFVKGRANPVRVQNLSHPTSAFSAAPAADPDHDTPLPLDEVRGPLAGAISALYGRVELHASGSCGFPPCALRDLPPDQQAALWRDRALSDAGDLAARTFVPACGGCRARDACPGLRREYVARHGDRGVAPL